MHPSDALDFAKQSGVVDGWGVQINILQRKLYHVYNAYIPYMTEISISARIPEDIFQELESFMKEESLEKSASIRKLLSEGLHHWKEERALKLLSPVYLGQMFKACI